VVMLFVIRLAVFMDIQVNKVMKKIGLSDAR
jgi:hypothetical protein